MTDITHSAPNLVRHGEAPRPAIHWPRLVAWLSAAPRLVGDAFATAYADPYLSSPRRTRVAADEACAGRDPNW